MQISGSAQTILKAHIYPITRADEQGRLGKTTVVGKRPRLPARDPHLALGRLDPHLQSTIGASQQLRFHKLLPRDGAGPGIPTSEQVSLANDGSCNAQAAEHEHVSP